MLKVSEVVARRWPLPASVITADSVSRFIVLHIFQKALTPDNQEEIPRLLVGRVGRDRKQCRAVSGLKILAS